MSADITAIEGKVKDNVARYVVSAIIRIICLTLIISHLFHAFDSRILPLYLFSRIRCSTVFGSVARHCTSVEGSSEIVGATILFSAFSTL